MRVPLFLSVLFLFSSTTLFADPEPAKTVQVDEDTTTGVDRVKFFAGITEPATNFHFHLDATDNDTDPDPIEIELSAGWIGGQTGAGRIGVDYSPYTSGSSFGGIMYLAPRTDNSPLTYDNEALTVKAMDETTTHVGIGTDDPDEKLHVMGAIKVEGSNNNGTTYEDGVISFQDQNDAVYIYLKDDNDFVVNNTDNTGTTFRIFETGKIRLNSSFYTSEDTYLCYASNGNLTTVGCSAGSSSIRHKENVADYSGGLEVLSKLRPVSFTWKKSKAASVGFVAEEVAEVARDIAVENKEGLVNGIEEKGLIAVLVNSVKEQQEVIENLRADIKELKKRQG